LGSAEYRLKHFGAASGTSLKDLMVRMGHDSERTAMIYQREAQGADLAITSAIDAHIETAKASKGQPGGGRVRPILGLSRARVAEPVGGHPSWSVGVAALASLDGVSWAVPPVCFSAPDIPAVTPVLGGKSGVAAAR
jgi:hypothetical protein